MEGRWGCAAHSSQSFNILILILNSLTGYRDHRRVPNRIGPAQPRFRVLIVQVCSHCGPEALPGVEQTASLDLKQRSTNALRDVCSVDYLCIRFAWQCYLSSSFSRSMLSRLTDLELLLTLFWLFFASTFCPRSVCWVRLRPGKASCVLLSCIGS